MNRIGTLYLLALTSLGVADATALEVRQSPYDRIAGRNLFQLQPPTTVKVITPVPKPPLRKIRLTGITTILGRPVAFITIEGAKSQPAESVMVTNGQIVNGIEVKSIDERAGVIRILNDGELQFLDFDPTKPPDLAPIQGCPKAPLNPAPPIQAQLETMAPEEQTALIELQRIKFKMEGNPIQALLPPTEMTSEINDKDAEMP